MSYLRTPQKRFLNTRLGLRQNLLVRFRLIFHKYGSLRDLREACLSLGQWFMRYTVSSVGGIIVMVKKQIEKKQRREKRSYENEEYTITRSIKKKDKMVCLSLLLQRMSISSYNFLILAKVRYIELIDPLKNTHIIYVHFISWKPWSS